MLKYNWVRFGIQVAAAPKAAHSSITFAWSDFNLLCKMACQWILPLFSHFLKAHFILADSQARLRCGMLEGHHSNFFLFLALKYIESTPDLPPELVHRWPPPNPRTSYFSTLSNSLILIFCNFCRFEFRCYEPFLAFYVVCWGKKWGENLCVNT